jgi:hypothetical protein
MMNRSRFAVLAVAVCLFTGSALARSIDPIRDGGAAQRIFQAAAKREAVKIHGLSLGRPQLDSVELIPMEIWDSHSRIIFHSEDGTLSDLPLPNARYFRGYLADDPESAIFVVVENGDIHGAVITSERRFSIGLGRPSKDGKMRASADAPIFLTEIDEANDAVQPETKWMCDIDKVRLHGGNFLPEGSGAAVNLKKVANAGAPSGATYSLRIAIDSDTELYVGFGSNAASVTSYVGTLIGFASTIYQRDLQTSLTVGTVQVRSTDTYTGGNTLAALGEFGTLWHNNFSQASFPRSAAIFLSGKAFNGGIAFTDYLCGADFFCGADGSSCGTAALANQYGGSYGVVGSTGVITTTVPDPNATVNGVLYGLPNTNNYWMLLAFAHELGHLVAAEHTSCYELTAPEQATYGVPGQGFIDLCLNTDGAGCYGGPVSAPTTEKGTIMSYCHNIFSGGFRESRYTFGQSGKPSEKMIPVLKTGIDAATPVGTITMAANLACAAGQTASVPSCGGCTYAWQITGGTITSATNTSSITFTPNAVSVTVTATVTNATMCAITASKTSPAACAACAAPAIGTQPVSGTIIDGSSTTLSVGNITGTAPFTYQWYTGTSGATGSPIGGAVSNSYQAQPSLLTTYWVRVTNACGNADSTTTTVAVQPANINAWYGRNDFNGDTNFDTLIRNSTTGDIGMWLMNGTTVTNGAVAGSPGLLWRVAGTGDFDGNGRTDLLIQNNDNGNIGVWLMNGFTLVTGATVGTPGRGWIALGAADLNGDNRDDIVIRNLANGDIGGWLIAAGGTSISSGGVLATPGLAWSVPGVGDFNGDGRDDILVRNDTTGSIGSYLMNGLAVSSSSPVGTPGTNFRMAGVADLNGNNRADIVMQNITTGDVGAWLMDGFVLQSAGVFAQPGTGWRATNFSDFNKDGKADLIVQNLSSGNIGQWQMNGLTLTLGSTYGTPGPVWTVVGSR